MSHNEGRPCSFSFTVLQKMQLLSHITFYYRVTWLISPQGALCAIIDWEMLLFEISTQSTPAVGHNSGSKSPKHYHCNPIHLPRGYLPCSPLNTSVGNGMETMVVGRGKPCTCTNVECSVCKPQPSWQCHRIGTAARPMGVLVILIVNPQFACNHFNSFGI